MKFQKKSWNFIKNDEVSEKNTFNSPVPLFLPRGYSFLSKKVPPRRPQGGSRVHGSIDFKVPTFSHFWGQKGPRARRSMLRARQEVEVGCCREGVRGRVNPSPLGKAWVIMGARHLNAVTRSSRGRRNNNLII